MHTKRFDRYLACAVPLYDSLGEDAVEYTVNHAETSAIFAQAAKLPQLNKALARIKKNVQTIVYWGEADSSTLGEAEKQVCMPGAEGSFVQSAGVSCASMSAVSGLQQAASSVAASFAYPALMAQESPFRLN